MEQTGDFPLGRFEHKYLVTDQVAVAVRNAIRPHLAVDIHAPPDSVRGYKVYSLYYDTPHLDFYRQTRAGEKRRVKLRVRFYDQEAGSVAFVEVKEKIDGQVYKRRYAADKAFVESMVRDPECDALKHALGNGGRGTALEEFCQRRKELGAVPKLFIAYEREAFNSTSIPPVRVTFDRRIRTNASGRDIRLAVPGYGANVGGLNVLIEFKYSGEPPAWLAEIEQSFLLKRASFSKFAECIDALQIFGSQPIPKRKKKSAAKKAVKRTDSAP